MHGLLHACGNNERFSAESHEKNKANPSMPSVINTFRNFKIGKISCGKIISAITTNNQLLIWGFKSPLYKDHRNYLQYELMSSVAEIKVFANEGK